MSESAQGYYRPCALSFSLSSSWATHPSCIPGRKQAPLEVTKPLVSFCLLLIGHLHPLLLSLDADKNPEKEVGQGGVVSPFYRRGN